MRVEGQPNLSQDAGLLLVPNPGLIIGWVWEDWDDDGIQDDDEVGLDGVTLNLLSESRAGGAPRRRGGRTGRGQAGGGGQASFKKLDSTTSDPYGAYWFAVPPGTERYRVEIEPPGSHQIVLRDQGLDDGLDSDVSQVSRRSDRLDARQYDVIDIGLTPFISISDWAWVDADRDGIQDADEKGLPDVFVLRYRLLKQANEFVFEDATFTDGDGFYEFDRLRPGRYHLRFLPPDGYDYTLWDVGDIPTVDSDALRDTGVTPDIVLPDDAVRSSTFSDLITNRWDAGFVPGPRDVTQVSLDVADNPVVCDTGKPVKDPEVTISKVRAGRLSNGDRWFLVKMVKGLETDYSFAVVLNIRTPFGVITFIFETHDKRFRIGQVDSKTGELIAEAGEDLQIFNDQDLGVVGFLIPADVIADEADLAAIRSFHTPRKGEAKRCPETPSFNVAGP